MTNPNNNQSENSLGEITISEKNIVVKMVAKDRCEVIGRLGSLLYENGFVKETYTQAVLDREVVFPTGLQTPGFGMAIPHTDTEHVIRPAIAIATLANPISFQGMGMPDTEIQVSLVIMLAISDPKAVIPLLRSVLYILENAEALKALAKASNELEIKQTVENHIRAIARTLSTDDVPTGVSH
jgi:PTS system galactitol-specific IIA component